MLHTVGRVPVRDIRHHARGLAESDQTLEERESDVTMDVISRQIGAVLDAAGVASFADAVLAYEPVWAIGTGKTATPELAEEVHAFIRGRLKAVWPDHGDSIRILYGGSVKPENAASLLSQENIDGALVGGASLKVPSFVDIAKAAN